MSGQRHAVTAVGAMVLAAAGFAVGAGATSWRAREMRAEPWRALRIEHRGDGSTRTSVVFDNAKRPLAGVELLRRGGAPASARIETRSGEVLTARFGEEERPTSLEAPNGALVQLGYGGNKVRVRFLAADGSTQGETVLRAPIELRPPLGLARRRTRNDAALAWLAEALIGTAHAAEEGPVTVEREVTVQLDVSAAGGAKLAVGRAEVHTSCAPFTCLPVPIAIEVPGRTELHLAVSRTIDKRQLGELQGSELGPFEVRARRERAGAAKTIPNITAVLAAVGVTAIACSKLGRSGPLCVAGLGSNARRVAAAIHAVSTHDIGAPEALIRKRAVELFYEEKARGALDQQARIEVCISRSGFARACTHVEGHPFAAAPMAPVARALELRPGLGDALTGSFELSQSDGADCKFSPSPKTSGKLRLSFDEKQGEMKAELSANDSGTRPGLSCSLGNATMRWTQSYSATASQKVSKTQLTSALALRLEGTMRGSGSFSFNGCRSRSGAAVGCPGGKSDSYSYRIVLTGSLDPNTRRGQGRIDVSGAPLRTIGSWRITEGQDR